VNVAIIPARGGSRRIPRKNIRDFLGRPIIWYSIQAAKSSGLFDRVVVSSGDDEIRAIAAGMGAEVHRRSPEASRDEVGTQEVMREVLEAARYSRYDIACCIYPCAPLMTARDLRNGYQLFVDTDSTQWWLYTPGWFYFGTRESYILERPLHLKACTITPTARWIDIDTEEDWVKAERIYREIEAGDALNTRGNL
jgi:CMP-N-acetylneuraminic acid synthetase